MGNEIIVGNWIATRQENGSYLYKAKETSRPSFLTKPKPVYKESPQHPLITEYENVAKKRYKQELHIMTIDIIKFFKTL